MAIQGTQQHPGTGLRRHSRAALLGAVGLGLIVTTAGGYWQTRDGGGGITASPQPVENAVPMQLGGAMDEQLKAYIVDSQSEAQFVQTELDHANELIVFGGGTPLSATFIIAESEEQTAREMEALMVGDTMLDASGRPPVKIVDLRGDYS